MDVQRIEEIDQAEMAGLRCDSREPGWILYHGKRAGKLAAMPTEKLNCQVDRNILYNAGLFHDIGKGNDLHNEVGANLTHPTQSRVGSKKGIRKLFRNGQKR